MTSRNTVIQARAFRTINKSRYLLHLVIFANS
jgi:hypothetical protein